MKITLLLVGLVAISAGASLSLAVPEKKAGKAVDTNVKAEMDNLGVSEKLRNADRTQHPDAQWYPDAALGLFIHFGTSSVRAINLSNIMTPGRPLGKKRIDDPVERERIIREKDYDLTGKGPEIIPLDYWTMARDFNPLKYDPDKWIAAAKEAGFTYAVLTTKHHEGFALWPSAAGDFNTKNWAGGKDLVRSFVEACRKHGLKVGLYFSPPDWYFDRDFKNFLHSSAVKLNPEFPELGPDLEPRKTAPTSEGLGRHQEAYAQMVRTQIEELLTRYGKIDLLWFDGSPDLGRKDGKRREIISLERIRQLQPGIVINPRLFGSGDFVTFERYENFPKKRPPGWAEFCDTGWTNSWAYADLPWRAPAFVLGYLPRSRAWGMNYLLNVGPKADGQLPPETYENFAILARWMKANRKSIHGAGPLPDGEAASVPATAAGDTRYLFAIPKFQPADMPYAKNQLPPKDEILTLSGISKPKAVVILATGERLAFNYSERVLRINLPAKLRSDLVDVVQIKLSLEMSR